MSCVKTIPTPLHAATITNMKVLKYQNISLYFEYVCKMNNCECKVVSLYQSLYSIIAVLTVLIQYALMELNRMLLKKSINIACRIKKHNKKYYIAYPLVQALSNTARDVKSTKHIMKAFFRPHQSARIATTTVATK